MSIPKERLASTAGLARATVDRKVREGMPLCSDEGSRVLGMARLIGHPLCHLAHSAAAG